MKNFIYGLQSPIDWKFYYVGCSSKNILRPYTHYYNTHNSNVAEWVKTLGCEPMVVIFEREVEFLFERETHWIQILKSRGEPLLNVSIPQPKNIEYTTIVEIGNFIKKKRASVNLTQHEFAEKAGIALTVVRKLEQGNPRCHLPSVLQALKMFGATLIIGKLNSENE